MPLLETSGLIILAGLAWFWIDSLSTREIALAAARELCTSEDKQLLDENVIVRHLRLMRDDAGRLRIGRSYDFEYSEFADERRRGRVVMLGHEVVMVNAGLRRVH